MQAQNILQLWGCVVFFFPFPTTYETPIFVVRGIKASDAESEIKKAYRKAALKHHPDKVVKVTNIYISQGWVGSILSHLMASVLIQAGQFLAKTDGGDDGRSWKDILEKVHEDADRLFKMIGEAYAVLSDPDKVLHLFICCMSMLWTEVCYYVILIRLPL